MTPPRFGLSSDRLQRQSALASVKNPLKVGHRGIDTAQIYLHDTEVGVALRQIDQ